VALAIVLTVALWFVDKRFEVLWRARQIPHEEILPEHTDFQFVIKPSLFQAADLVQMPGIEARVPAWLPLWTLKWFVPYEVAIVSKVEYERDQIDVGVFVNERRLGPVIARAFNAGLSRATLPGVTWDRGGMQRLERGAMVLRGRAPLSLETVFVLTSRWNQGVSRSPLELEGDHALEMLLDNRDGGAFAVIDQLLRTRGPIPADSAKEITSALEDVAVFRVWADLDDGGDAAELQMTIQLRPDAKDGGAGRLEFTRDLLTDQLSDYLWKSRGIALERVSSTWSEDEIEATYTLSPVSALFVAAPPPTRAPRYMAPRRLPRR